MKKIYLLPALLFFVTIINAQIVNIPDANFIAKLLQADVTNDIARDFQNQNVKIDINSNGLIEESEALLISHLDVSNSNIASLQGLEKFTNLFELYCNNNQLVALNVTANINLNYIDCKNNLLTTLDTSTIIDLGFGVSCDNNQLTSLNLKGIGSSFNVAVTGLTYSNNPNLHYICIRTIDLSNSNSLYNYLQQTNSIVGITSCEINSYCSFNPGGTFYTIQGNSRYDYNSNGCDTGDINYPNMSYYITDGTIAGNTIANISGSYSIPLQAGSYSITPVFENPTYFNVFPITANFSFPASPNPLIQDFCITANGIHNDLDVTLLSFSGTLGQNAFYKLVYKNKGTQIQSGTINLSFEDAILDFVSANPAISAQATNLLTWSFTNLQPFESRTIDVIIHLNSPTDIPALNNGDILHYTASINGLSNDETPSDNTFIINQGVYSSYDPNNIMCLEGATINPNKIGDYVNYIVHFENTGTANAQNIVIKDLFDVSKFDVSSLRITDTSHSCTTKISDINKVEFIFQNINLPFVTGINDGYVAFKIKTKSNLEVGNQIQNTANIYFDYNIPITTNSETSTFQTLDNKQFSDEHSFIIYPNPAKNTLNIISKNISSFYSISIFNTLGQQIFSVIQPSQSIDVSSLKPGTYFLKIKTETGIVTEKLLKQ